MAERGLCAIDGCESRVQRAGFRLCYPHWKAQAGGGSAAAPKLLSSTKLGSEFGISNQRVSLVFAELGWMEKGPAGKGWIPTTQGLRRGAVQRTVKRSGVPYVVWPAEITQNRVLASTVAAICGQDQAAEPETAPPTSAAGAEATDTSLSTFRDRFPAKMRTQDGHMVRSRGEAMIDNWLYHNQVVHAYERRLPIEQEVYCDFWIPAGRVYIEYWGLEAQPRYAKRMAEKKAIYAENDLRLVEITDAHLNALDDTLPALLLPFGVRSG